MKRNLKRVRRRAQNELRRVRAHLVRARNQSPSENVYHCCVHRTASQWFGQLFNDYRTYRASGLHAYHYQSRLPGRHDPRPIAERRFSDPFPQRRIVSPLYVDYEGYLSIPKPERYRTFYVLRDPRDVVVSWYFSARYSHRLMGDLHEVRPELQELSTEDGLIWSIEHLAEFGTFAAIDSWWQHGPADPNVLLVRFEEITGPDANGELTRLFDHLEIGMDPNDVKALLEKYSFESMSGRRQGKEDLHAHYRSGTAGWSKYFTDRTHDAMASVTGDLVARLEY